VRGRSVLASTRVRTRSRRPKLSLAARRRVKPGLHTLQLSWRSGRSPATAASVRVLVR
jgi:hypothetical protein